MKKIRLDKLLSDMGMGTRKEIKKELIKGSVTINGLIVKAPESKIDTGKDIICFCGQPVIYKEYEYFMLNKPAGVVSATEDRKDRTVLDLIVERKRNDLFPVGRLDKDTEGLLLITNDGTMAHHLLSPKKHVDKLYFTKVKGYVTEEEIRKFAEGIDIGDEKKTLPANLFIRKSDEISEVEVTIREGRFHQIKRMFASCAMEVVYLKRLSMGTLTLDPSLAPGEYRRLTEEEVKKLC